MLALAGVERGEARVGHAELGVELTANGAIVVDEWQRAPKVPNIYAVGDITDRINLTPVAIAEGRAIAETLFNNNPTKMDHADVPSAVFSNPPVGVVGLTEDQAFALMDAALAAGIDWFDTADAYGGGRSEQAIGRWMAARGVRPRLTTKTFNPMDAGADHGLKPDRIARQLRSSLDRLGVGQVELYLAHEYDPDVPLAETFGAFGTAQADGLIGAYGVSNFDAPQLAAALAAGTPRAVQNSYSLLARQDEPDLLPLCAGRGVAYLAFGPLAGGWLTGKYRRGAAYPAGSRMTQRPGPYQDLVAGATFDALDRLEAIAAARGTSLAGLALGWLLADERVAQVVIGPGRPEHLAPVAEALRQPVTEAERAEIEAELASIADPPRAGLSGKAEP